MGYLLWAKVGHLKISPVTADPGVTQIIQPARKTISPEKTNKDLCRRKGTQDQTWPTKQANAHHNQAPKLPIERIANRSWWWLGELCGADVLSTRPLGTLPLFIFNRLPLMQSLDRGPHQGRMVKEEFGSMTIDESEAFF